MDTKTILTIVIVASIFLSFTLFVVWKIISRKSIKDGTYDFYKSYEQIKGSSKNKRKQKMNVFLQDSYRAYSRVWILRRYIDNIRKRIQAIHSYDELTMRRETMKIVFSTLSIIATFILILLLMNFDLTFFFMVLFGAIILNGMLIDTFVHKVEDRLLVQLRDLLKVVRHNYHQHGMIEDALLDASNSSGYEASLHAKKIHDVLVSSKPYESLAAYYELAPNRFLKAFAGMSFLIKEFGDKTVKNGSLYLDNLNKLTSEIDLEILKRSKLNYRLKSLTTIAVVPILFTKPIETWARQQFPAMDEFYSSKLGFIIKIIIFAVILLSYILIKKIQDQQEGTYIAKVKKRHWENLLLKVPGVSWIVDQLTPSKKSPEHRKVSRLLKDANASFPINWHYLHKFILSIICSTVLFLSFLTMHSIEIKNILEAPTSNSSLFGKLSDSEMEKAQTITDFDRNIILQLKEVSKEKMHDRIVQLVKQDHEIATNDSLLNNTTKRILTKVGYIDAEYIKWWEVLASFLMGWIGYKAPYWLLLFQKRMRQMDMQNEVDQFHTIIAMLSQIDRVSVEVIIEWMERFSSIFKAPLHKCVLNYEAGAEQALEQLKLDAPFVPLVRTVEKLQLAVERIPIQQAFDDLETERNYYFEERKQQYEKSIESKAGWGQLIGFTPMYALVFLYLVFPFIYVSFQQMGTYVNQINMIQ